MLKASIGRLFLGPPKASPPLFFPLFPSPSLSLHWHYLCCKSSYHTLHGSHRFAYRLWCRHGSQPVAAPAQVCKVCEVLKGLDILQSETEQGQLLKQEDFRYFWQSSQCQPSNISVALAALPDCVHFLVQCVQTKEKVWCTHPSLSPLLP